MMGTHPCLSCVSFPWDIRLQMYINLQFHMSFLGRSREGKTPQAGWNFSLIFFFPELYYIYKGLKQHLSTSEKISNHHVNKINSTMK